MVAKIISIALSSFSIIYCTVVLIVSLKKGKDKIRKELSFKDRDEEGSDRDNGGN